MIRALLLLFILHLPAVKVKNTKMKRRSSDAEPLTDLPLWDSWSTWSTCSRHCGGGVTKRARVCLLDVDHIWAKVQHNRKIDVNVVCPGDAREYKSCNIEPCTTQGGANFRELQCSLFNMLRIHGKSYDWIPYNYHHDNTSAKEINLCALNCYPDGHNWYMTFSDSVIDGTPCLLDNNKPGVCADGTCLATGCDGLIGSRLEYDKCGVCGGNGTSCFTTTERYKQTVSKRSYHPIFLIPEGAQNIHVLQTRQTKSFLSISDAISFEPLINGNWTVELPGLYNIAGTVFNYSRDVTPLSLKQHGLESFYARGPTTCPLIITMLAWRRGHQFHRFNLSYSRPIEDHGATISFQSTFRHYPDHISWRLWTHSHPKIKRPRFKKNFVGFDNVELPIKSPINHSIAQPQWVEGPFSSCSKSCGGGIKTITYQCRQGVHLLHNSACKSAARPHNRTKQCNTMDCPPSWEYGPWSSCSRTCGSGMRTRTAECWRMASSVATQPISSKWCAIRVQEMSSNCCLCAGGGKQKLPSKCCSSIQPITQENCKMQKCWGIWKVSKWQPCSNKCGNEFQYRNVSCFSNKTGQQLHSSNCNPETRPVERRSCRLLDSCVRSWYAGPFGPCSVTCGKGVHNREIICIIEVNSSGNITYDVLPDRMCDAQQKPRLVTKVCTKPACDPNWVTSSWSQCSKTCHTEENYRHRTVKCMTDGKPTPGKCNYLTKPYVYVPCTQSWPCAKQLNEPCVDRHPMLCSMIKHSNYWKYNFCSIPEIKQKCCRACF